MIACTANPIQIKINVLKNKRLTQVACAFAFFVFTLPGTSFANVTIPEPSLTVTTCGSFPTTSSTLGNIVISENQNNDISTFGTLILTAPTNFEFTPAGSITVSGVGDITSASIALTNSTTITITIASTQCNKTNDPDQITISGIQVRGINSASGPTDVWKTGGTAVIAGVTNNVTAFATLTS